MLVKELKVSLQAVGFDPMLGLYHQPRYGRPSLALELAEEFSLTTAELSYLQDRRVAFENLGKRTGIAGIKADGSYNTIFKKYFGTEPAAPMAAAAPAPAASK